MCGPSYFHSTHLTGTIQPEELCPVCVSTELSHSAWIPLKVLLSSYFGHKLRKEEL